MNRIVVAAVAALGLVVNVSWADEAALGPQPKQIVPVVETHSFLGLEALRLDRAVRNSNDLQAAIGFQTPVKSQGGRGTCSIFSATGALESLLKIRDNEEHDLSENYLEYLVMTRMKSYPSEGSDTNVNFPAYNRYGAISESSWPYETQDWTKGGDSEKAKKVCGHLTSTKKLACLLGHMDPDRDEFASEAAQFRNDYRLYTLGYAVVNSQQQIKNILNSNQPMILSVDFFYGAWNHRLMEEYGIGKRDMKKWAQGVVSTPTSQDVQLSHQHPAGHSIVVVGYNDAEKVYYFKNSWGTGSFGAQSDILGSNSTDGYGKISYGYAHNYGTFFQVGIQ